VHPNPGFDIEIDEPTLFQINLLRDRRQYKALDIFGNLNPQTHTPEAKLQVAPDPEQRPNAQTPAPVEPSVEPTVTEDPVLNRALEYLQNMLDAAQNRTSAKPVAKRTGILS
jgi:hypothetical protein